MPETVGRPDGNAGIIIDAILQQMGLTPAGSKPQNEPEPPSTKEHILVGLSYVAEAIAFALLFTSFIAVGISIVGIIGIATRGSFLELGIVNSAVVAIAGGISGSAVMSAAISIRKIAQDVRTPNSLKNLMKSAGIKL